MTTRSESRSVPDYDPLYLAGYIEEWAAHIEENPDRAVPSSKLGGEILAAAAKYLRTIGQSSEITSRDPDLCEICGLLKQDGAVQGDACPGHRPSAETMRRKIESAGDDEPTVIGASSAITPSQVADELLKIAADLREHDFFYNARRIQNVAEMLTSSSTASPEPLKRCQGLVCKAAQIDNIVCAEGECDFASGVRKPQRMMVTGFENGRFVRDPVASPSTVTEPLARVEKTTVGPVLWVAGVKVHWWFGTMHDEEIEKMAAQINASIPQSSASVAREEKPRG